MALKHNLLGLIARKPDGGYSLHKRFFKPGRPMLSQIYRALNDMSSEGLVFFKRVDQRKLPARNVFYLTEAGEAELKRWLEESSVVAPIKEEVAQKLWFASLGRIEDALALLESFRDARQAELKYYSQTAKKIERRDLTRFGTPLDKMYWDLVLDYVRRRAKAEVAWAQDAIQKLSNATQEMVGESEWVRKESVAKEPAIATTGGIKRHGLR